MIMSELRRNPMTGRWVIIAPERGHRPREAQTHLSTSTKVPAFDPTCPFCPGNEAKLPGLIAEMKSGQEPGWRTRVAPNKFPVVGLDSASRRRTGEIYETAAALGSHKILIESPCHDRDMRCMSTEEVRDVLSTYLDRHHVLMAQAAMQSVILFRNCGSAAGASLRHPHSDDRAASGAAARAGTRSADARSSSTNGALYPLRYHRSRTKRRLACCRRERAFVTVVPFAASVPCELWILPKRH